MHDHDKGSHEGHDHGPMIDPVFAVGKIEPIEVFINGTMHSPQSFFKARLDADFASVPEATRNEIFTKAMSKLGAGREMGEYQVLILAHDKERDTYMGIATYYKEYAATGKEAIREGAILLGETDDKDSAVMAHTLCALKHKTTRGERVVKGEWQGDPQPFVEVSAESWEECQEKLQSAGVLDVFTRIFPSAITGTNPIPTVAIAVPDEKMSAQKRKELVKRFGEAAIKKLEASIKTKAQTNGKN